MEKIIEVNELTKNFINGQIESHVIKNINFSVNKGEFISIIGPSGSGKSTLLYLLGALDKPTTGSVRICGNDISKMNDKQASEERRKRIGFIFQFYNLIPNFSVEENVMLPVIMDGKKIHQYKDQVNDLLNIVGLYDKRHFRPKELSGGQQQRVAIARALINNPDIVLADEATGNLDTKTGNEVMCLLQKLNQLNGVSIVQVTHNMETCVYGTRIINIVDGQIVRDDEVKK